MMTNMEMLPAEALKKLYENGETNNKHRGIDGNTEDFQPVVKFFNPMGAATWLISEIEASGEDMDGNHDYILFGLCDLGFGSPEMGSVSYNEIRSVRLAGDMGIERDIHFRPTKTLTEYAADARAAGRIEV